MSPNKIPLELIEVASPCTASWADMAGDDQTRFCAHCSQYVYNLSELSQEQAETLVMEHEGKLCVRYYQRPDGTVMTKDCPIGWRAMKRHISLAGCIVAAGFVLLFGFLTVGAFAGGKHANGGRGPLPRPIQMVVDWIWPPEIAGQLCPPRVAPAPPPNPPAPVPLPDAKQ